MRATAVLVVVIAALLAATLRSGTVVGLEVVGEAYRPGESATVRLHNRSNEPIGYNACTWTLERRGEIGWRPAPQEDERMCTMELRQLAPGASARPTFPLNENLPAGRYRLRADLHRMDAGGRIERHTDSFRIDR